MHDEPAVEVRVNFGMLAGREATPAEIDDLAAVLLNAAPQVSIISEQRHEIGPDVEASLHQVRIELEHGVVDEIPRRSTRSSVRSSMRPSSGPCIARPPATLTCRTPQRTHIWSNNANQTGLN